MTEQYFHLGSSDRVAAQPDAVGLLGMTLARGIRDTVEDNGYRSVCLSLDDPNSSLLAVLCVHALGASQVGGVTFSGKHDAADALGIKCRSVDLSGMLSSMESALGSSVTDSTAARLKGNLLCSIAEEHGQMLLTSLDRQQLMTGQFILYGETCGFLAPLGNLCEMDINMLCRHFSEQYVGVFGASDEFVPRQKDVRRIHGSALRSSRFLRTFRVDKPKR